MLNFRLFREQLNETFSYNECNFLIRTYFYAAAMFFGLGAFLLCLLQVNSVFPFILEPVFFIPGYIVTFFLSIILFKLFNKYESKPLEVNKLFINKIFLVLCGTYTFFFLIGFQVLNIILNLTSVLNQSLIIIHIFGIAILAYLIPSIISYFLMKYKTIMLLKQFLFYCSSIIMILLIISMIGLLIFGTISSSIDFFILLIMGIIVFLSPALTAYRLKMTSRYIDYTDSEGLFKWQMFFIFQILYGLFSLVLHILRIVIYILDNKSQ